VSRNAALYYTLVPRLTPGLRNSHALYARELAALVPAAARWLDIGCGHEHLPAWLPEAERRLDPGTTLSVGADPDLASLGRHPTLTHRVGALGEALPFRTGSFDLVTANMVLEHVKDPAAFLAEVRRVLAPGGRVLLHTPSRRGYTTLMTRLVPPAIRPALAVRLQGRREEDVYPTWYRANTPETIARLAQRAGFGDMKVRLVETSPLFARWGAVVWLELLLIRALRRERLSRWRPCLLITLA
jgi:SAM-dependent methyltransferase